MLLCVTLEYANLEPVYHGQTGVRTLRELARSYLTIVKDLSRVMNRLEQSWSDAQMVSLRPRVRRAEFFRKGEPRGIWYVASAGEKTSTSRN
jgi:hypothetical protein